MRKTFRDIRETIGSFISITVVLFVGCFIFSGVMTGIRTITAQVDDYYTSQFYATARGEYMYVNSATVDEISNNIYVARAAGYNTYHTRTRGSDMTVTTLTDGIDVPLITEGRLPQKNAREIIIDSVYAESHGVGVGDKLTFDIQTLKTISLEIGTQGTGGSTAQYSPEYRAVSYGFTVCGIYHSPDIIYKVNLLNTAARSDEFVCAMVNYGEIPAYLPDATVTYNGIPVFRYSSIPDGVEVYTGVKILGSDGLDAQALFSAYSINVGADSDNIRNELLGIFDNPNKPAGLFMYGMERDGFPSVTAFNGINDTMAQIAAVLPLIFFLVAAVITVISLSKTVDNQRTQIGVIQALGISKSQVYFQYIFYALFASIIGGLSGGIVGTYLVPFLLNIIYARQFSMPPTPQSVSPLFMFVGLIIAAALASLAAFVSCHRTLKVKPAQAMRPKPPKKTKRILAERWTWLWKKLGFGAKMNLRNMFLHKIKMLLSSVGIVGCLALLVALVGLKDNMAFSLDSYENSTHFDLTVITDIAVDASEFDLEKVISEVDPDGRIVDKFTFAPDFSGRFEFGGRTADMTVTALPTEEEAAKLGKHADPYCIELFTDARATVRLKMRSDTFAVPSKLADEMGIEKGDTVTVSGYSLDNRAVEFEATVTDIVYEYFDVKVYTSYEIFETSNIGLHADTSYAKVKSGAAIGEAVDILKEYEAVRDVKSFAETFGALKKQMEFLDYAVILFVVAAAVLAIAVIYNITATNLKERTREIATLMVLGYKQRETANMIIVENMVITALGCILGLPLGYGLLIWLVGVSTSFNVFISSFFSWYVAVGCVLLTFAFSLAATMLLNTRMKKISMVEALKSVE